MARNDYIWGINWPKFGRMLSDLNQTCIKMKSCQIFYVVFIAFCIADSMSFKLGKTSVRASCPPKPSTVSELDTQKVIISSTFQWNKIFFWYSWKTVVMYETSSWLRMYQKHLQSLGLVWLLVKTNLTNLLLHFKWLKLSLFA